MFVVEEYFGLVRSSSSLCIIIDIFCLESSGCVKMENSKKKKENSKEQSKKE